MESVKVHGDAPFAPERFANLFNEAVHLSSTAPPAFDEGEGTPVGNQPASPANPIDAITKAQEDLKKDILNRIPDAIRLAAAKGATQVDVFTFHGNQKFSTPDTEEEFPILFLLKGPTDHEQRHKLANDGFVPLLEGLRREVAPFDLRHSWTVGTNINKVTLTWQRHCMPCS